MEPTIRGKYQKIFEKAGRPRFYNSPEELRDAVITYFTECEETMRPPTLSGLKGSLGFSTNNRDNSSFHNYAKFGKEYEQIVDMTETILREYYEECLMSKNFKGAQFWLQAKDKWTVTTKVETLELTASKEEIEKELQNLKKIENLDDIK
jgi:hypothetical protein